MPDDPVVATRRAHKPEHLQPLGEYVCMECADLWPCLPAQLAELVDRYEELLGQAAWPHLCFRCGSMERDGQHKFDCELKVALDEIAVRRDALEGRSDGSEVLR